MMNAHSTKFAGARISTRIVEIVSNTTYQYFFLATITFLAVVLRFYKLGAWSFWIDEIYEIGYSLQAMARFPDLTRVSLLLTGITLHYLPVNEWSARLVPAIIGIVSIPILYFPIKKLFNPAVALLAVALLAISPWHLYWSQNARFYSFLLLFYTLGQFALFFWLESNRPGYLILAGLLLFMATLERMVAAFIAPVVVVYFIALLTMQFGRPAGLRWKNILLLAIPAGLFALYQVFSAGFLNTFTLEFVGHQRNPVRVLLAIVYDIGLPLFVAGILGGLYLLLQKSRIGLYLLLGAVVPVILLVIISPFTPASTRYVFITLPSWVILGAYAAERLLVQAQKQTKFLALAVLLVLVAEPVSQDVLYYGFQNGNREDFKSAFALVQKLKADGDLVVSTRDRIGDYYLGEEVVPSSELDLDAVARSGRRTWFVIDNRTYVSPQLQQWLDEHSQLKGVYDVYIAGKIMMMRVYLFDPGKHASS